MSRDRLYEAIELLESTANMLRGMTLDPAIPEHAKEAIKARLETLDEFTNAYFDDDDSSF